LDRRPLRHSTLAADVQIIKDNRADRPLSLRHPDGCGVGLLRVHAGHMESGPAGTSGGHSAGDESRAGVRSSAVSWPRASTIAMARMAAPASTSSPSVKLPVESLIRPITDGPTKPARFPIELMMAMPPAAAAPDRKAVGSVQNTGRAPKMPNPATLNANIFALGSSRKAATIRLAAATKIAKAV